MNIALHFPLSLVDYIFRRGNGQLPKSLAQLAAAEASRHILLLEATLDSHCLCSFSYKLTRCTLTHFEILFMQHC